MPKKIKEKAKKRKTGRPRVISQAKLRKLEGAFADGASDKEACFLAEIAESTLYKYQEDNPDFIERKKYLKNLVKFQAKKNIRKLIQSGDKQVSMWYAERKMKDEFSTRQEMTGKDGKDLPVPIYGGKSNNDVSGHVGNTEDISSSEEN